MLALSYIECVLQIGPENVGWAGVFTSSFIFVVAAARLVDQTYRTHLQNFSVQIGPGIAWLSPRTGWPRCGDLSAESAA